MKRFIVGGKAEKAGSSGGGELFTYSHYYVLYTYCRRVFRGNRRTGKGKGIGLLYLVIFIGGGDDDDDDDDDYSRWIELN